MDAQLWFIFILSFEMKQILFIIFCLLMGCKKIHYYPDKNIEIKPTQLIAHRGGRTLTIRENTLIGIKAALYYKDGIEVDVMISKSENIWLSHSEIVKGCNKTLKCFAETKDEDIKAITTCNGQDISYTQLEDVFKFMHDSFPAKLICIDLKGWVPCSGNSIDIEGMMRREGEIIIQMAQKYGLASNLMFEIEATSVLDYLKSKQSGAKTYLVAYGDFERAMLISLKQNYTGISYKTNFKEELTKEKIDLIHKKGLRMLIWNLIDNATEIPYYTNMGVDFIQMDLK